MLNEEKIRLMTNMAMFEKKNGKAMNSGKNYFKSDYISRNMIRGFQLHHKLRGNSLHLADLQHGRVFEHSLL